MTTNKINPKARHKARCLLVQALYQQAIAEQSFEDIEDQFIKDEFSKGADLNYFVKLWRGISEQKLELDKKFNDHLDIALDKLDTVELAVLRMATYELVNESDIPYKVILNEALELTKTYGGQDGHKFINGVLDQVAKKLRQDEL